MKQQKDSTKDLKSMTLEELWQLFPITLSPHRPVWRQWAEEEMNAIAQVLADYSPVINHIGSTAIPSICAKPIIDILVEMEEDADWQHITDIMETSGYICMSASGKRASFNKGYTPQGYAERVFHIHVRAKGDNDELNFLAYLLEHADIAHEYEVMKQSLLPAYRHNRDGYTAAKSEFVNKVTAMAKLQRENLIL